MKAIPLSAGLALGTVFLHKDREQEYRRSICPGEVESEISRFRSGRNRAAASLEKLIEKVRREVGDSEAEIFEGHLEILTSEDLEEEVVERITSSLVGAEQAVMDFAEENAAEMEELESEYFRERGQDFRALSLPQRWRENRPNPPRFPPMRWWRRRNLPPPRPLIWISPGSGGLLSAGEDGTPMPPSWPGPWRFPR